MLDDLMKGQVKHTRNIALTKATIGVLRVLVKDIPQRVVLAYSTHTAMEIEDGTLVAL